MKIFLVIPTLKQGGAERIMHELANNFNLLGHEVHLCLLTNRKVFYVPDRGVHIHRLGFENKNHLQKKISELKTFYKLRQLMVDIGPDVVLSFMDKYNVLTILASRFLNLKVFVSDRSNPKKTISPILQFLKRLTYKHATGIVAQTSLAKEIIFELTNNPNIKVISNPLKHLEFYPEIKRERLIINVGRLVPEKGQKYLIEAFSKLSNTDWKLVILGDGTLKGALKNQIKMLGLEDRVIMPGSVRNVDEWLARSSIFAFPSVSEGFPNALVEAMGAGLPCVSFDCDAGPKDIIVNNENGFLIETRNIAAFTEHLNTLCSDVTLRTKVGAQALKISERLDGKVITNEYLNFFNPKDT